MSWDQTVNTCLCNSKVQPQIAEAILYGPDGQIWCDVQPNSSPPVTLDKQKLTSIKDFAPGKGIVINGEKFFVIRIEDGLVGLRKGTVSLVFKEAVKAYGLVIVGNDGTSVQDCFAAAGAVKDHLAANNYA